MAEKRQVVLNKEELVAKIRMLHVEHKNDSKCRSLIIGGLNRAGIPTLTGKEWNSGRLNQFIRANIPDMLEKPKTKDVGGKTEPAAAAKKAADIGGEHIDVFSPDPVSTLKEEVRAMVDELIESAKRDSREALDRMLPEVRSSIAADLKQDLDALAQETGKLLSSEIASAAKEYDQRLESSMTRFKAELDETLGDFRTEMRTLVKEEVQKALADYRANGDRVDADAFSESRTDMQPKEHIESLVKQEVESAMKGYKPPEAATKAPMALMPAVRVAEMVETGVVWWMKALLNPKR